MTEDLTHGGRIQFAIDVVEIQVYPGGTGLLEVDNLPAGRPERGLAEVGVIATCSGTNDDIEIRHAVAVLRGPAAGLAENGKVKAVGRTVAAAFFSTMEHPRLGDGAVKL